MEKINSALISVYNKQGIDKIATLLVKYGIKIYSTGGTAKYLKERMIPITEIEEVTSYPSILGGRVKTLHPKVFGGILARRDNEADEKDLQEYAIPLIDLIIVDLYPFEETVASGASEKDIIEKIDIGGISLIRAAAKNFYHTWIVSHKNQYDEVIKILEKHEGYTDKDIRRKFAIEAFNVSSHYDTQIYNYFNNNPFVAFKQSITESKSLRYGENPHQKGVFWGNFKEMFTQLHGKEISYNNILDIDAAVGLILDFMEEPTIAILKHNNACGLTTRENLKQAWVDALAGDPLSAFGGIIITNRQVTEDVAEEMNKIFFEVVIAPSYTDKALEILKQKKNRIILVQNKYELPQFVFRTALNGVLFQERDNKTETPADLKSVTNRKPTEKETEDLLFANKIVKHTKSNAIVLVKDKQLIGSGTGQTSRVDALKQAIAKAKTFGFDLNGAVMASDAFFPFKDSVEIAYSEGITAVIQPGGSIRDKESIDFCNEHDMAMVFTGIRHFKH